MSILKWRQFLRGSTHFTICRLWFLYQCCDPCWGNADFVQLFMYKHFPSLFLMYVFPLFKSWYHPVMSNDEQSVCLHMLTAEILENRLVNDLYNSTLLMKSLILTKVICLWFRYFAYYKQRLSQLKGMHNSVVRDKGWLWRGDCFSCPAPCHFAVFLLCASCRWTQACWISY